MFAALLAAAALPLTAADLATAFSDRPGTLVLLDAATGETLRHDPALAATPLPPCSTFKIWNTALGLELGLLKSPDEPFWTWDGVTRPYPDWNHDLTLRQAYAASCVPAYQALARRIGPERMDAWLKRLDYGNRDTTSGPDVFWLPAPDRTPLLITPDQQAGLLRRLVTGALPFSPATLAALQTIMLAEKTERGTLYGKTGTGSPGKTTPATGWFVGYVVTGGRTLVFACALTDRPDATGKNARALVTDLFTRASLL